MLESNIIRNKIKVFISSRCGENYERYDLVRSELRKMIEGTHIAEVYLFEESGASTQTAQQDYLYALDDSDICIFLIDNADDVTPPILKEITRAKSFPKKSLYLFCNENEKEATQVQKELMGAKGSKYYIVDNFNDFIHHGYVDLINDIVNIYKNYCKNRLVDAEFELLEDHTDEKVNTTIISETLNKNSFSKMDKCERYFTNIVYPMEYEIENTSDLDGYLEQFLKVIWTNKDITDFNVGLLLDSLKLEMDDSLYSVVELRWKAIQSYWLDNLDKVLMYLNQAFKLAKEINMPDWLIQDILIDIRNTENLRGIHNNQLVPKTEAQLELNKMPRTLIYPVLDRFDKNFYEEINKEYIKNQIKSVYTVSLGNNLKKYLKNLSNIYYTASYYGSLSHILLLKNRVFSIVFNLCEEYSNWEFRVLLIKLSILLNDNKKVTNQIRYFNNILGKINDKDAKEIFDYSYTIPITKERLKYKFQAIKTIGYYLNDVDFEIIMDELLISIYKWIDNDRREVFMGSLIIDSINENRYRMNPDIIIDICIKMINKKTYRFFDNIFKLLGRMDFSDLKDKNKMAIKNVILDCVNNKEITSNSDELVNVIINLSKQMDEFREEIDVIVQEELNQPAKKVYFLETTNNDDAIYVNSYIDEIENYLQNQGKNGVYSINGHNTYYTVRRILSFNSDIMDSSMYNRLIKACEDSIYASNINYVEKTSAIQLLAFLFNKYKDYHFDYSSIYDRIEKNKPNILIAYEDIFQKQSSLTLEFNLILLQLSLGKIKILDLIDFFSIINQESDFEILESLKSLKNNIEKALFENLEEQIQNVLIQFVLSYKGHENMDIRYYSNLLLINILTQDNKDLILTHLSKSMDYENVYIKNLIITSFEEIIQYDNSAAHAILKKALLDNHYLVRKVANKYKRNIDTIS